MKDAGAEPAGEPGGQRVEVTARGKLIRELDPKPDRSGNTVQLAIDADLQEYTARMGEESGSCVILDCLTGDILAMVSMPAYDPNSFSDGIGRTEWKTMSEDPRKPLLNKVLNALYPPGSTLKPMAGLALQQHGIDPKDHIFCGGGYQLGNRFFRCLGRHGSVDMHRAIAKSCNTYFYAMSNRIGYDKIADGAAARSARSSTFRSSAKTTAPFPTVSGSGASTSRTSASSNARTGRIRHPQRSDRPGLRHREPAPIGRHVGAHRFRPEHRAFADGCAQ